MAMMVNDKPKAKRPIAVVPAEDDAELDALKVTQSLRQEGFTVDLGFAGKFSKRMKRASKINAAAVVILREDAFKLGVATVRDFESGEEEVSLASLADRLARYR